MPDRPERGVVNNYYNPHALQLSSSLVCVCFPCCRQIPMQHWCSCIVSCSGTGPNTWMLPFLWSLTVSCQTPRKTVSVLVEGAGLWTIVILPWRGVGRLTLSHHSCCPIILPCSSDQNINRMVQEAAKRCPIGDYPTDILSDLTAIYSSPVLTWSVVLQR